MVCCVLSLSVTCASDELFNWPLLFERWITLSNRPFYRYGGHIELIGFKEYYGMLRGHEHDPIYLHQYVRGLFGPIFL